MFNRRIILNVSVILVLFGITWTIQIIANKHTNDDIHRLEQRVEFFQKIWDNVPEEYRKEVAP